MKFYSTKNKTVAVSLREAILNSLPQDGGLYVPEYLPQLSKGFLTSLSDMSLQEIAFEVSKGFLSEDFTTSEIRDIIDNAVTFDCPLIPINKHIGLLELWHGPSMAFKDFGAKFMAAVMSKLVSADSPPLRILVATSGDTGGAVAAGFYKVPNVEVVILYPHDRVSPLQEKQLTTLGENIYALEVNGSFDDCQDLVKRAFVDPELNKSFSLSSANSINISRLIPQTFYYFESFKQARDIVSGDRPIVYSVPSGNFGNLTAGIMSQKMGLPIHHFIAATNINDTFPKYLESGRYRPQDSLSTISNAMDVGNPSNFERIMHFFGSDHSMVKNGILSESITDKETKATIKEVMKRFNYVIDPHGAVAFANAQNYLRNVSDNYVVVLETAHPAKFLPVMNSIIGEIKIPDALSSLASKSSLSTRIDASFSQFKNWICSNLS